jgi:hypothetical protein
MRGITTMATNKKTFFQCFSINFHRFLKANGLHSMSKGVHKNGRTFWVYERTENFEKCLKIWHDTKPVAEEKTV